MQRADRVERTDRTVRTDRRDGADRRYRTEQVLYGSRWRAREKREAETGNHSALTNPSHNDVLMSVVS